MISHLREHGVTVVELHRDSIRSDSKATTANVGADATIPNRSACCLKECDSSATHRK
jgi:hypothetical protein